MVVTIVIWMRDSRDSFRFYLKKNPTRYAMAAAILPNNKVSAIDFHKDSLVILPLNVPRSINAVPANIVETKNIWLV